MLPDSDAGGLVEASIGVAGERVRGRVAGWISVITAVGCALQGVFALLDRCGRVSVSNAPARGWTGLFALLCAVGSLVALALRRHFERVPGSRLTALLAVGLAVLTGQSLPATIFVRSIPQAVWLPTLEIGRAHV